MTCSAASLPHPGRIRSGWLYACALAIPIVCAAPAQAADEATAAPAVTVETIPLSTLPPNTRYAIWGDSITEVTLYPEYVEAYLLACAGRKDISVCTFGHSGEEAGGLVSRQTDLAAFHPTLVSFLWGMNDTHYTHDTPEKDAGYEKNTRASIALLDAKGIRNRIIVAPTFVDQLYGKDDKGAFFAGVDAHGMTVAQGQNETLAHFRAIAQKVAKDSGAAFADVHNRMEQAYNAAAKVLGPTYSIGVHVTPNGALMIAHELLKSLGCDGDIGTITVDMRGGAKATTGHAIDSFKDGVLEVTSTRYPFCANYDAQNSVGPNSLASILPYLPFAQELNRFVLKISNLGAPSATVTWGGETRTFTSDQLAAGINLAAEFPHTPFDATFGRFIHAVWDKQQWETFMIKGTSNYFGNDNGGNVDANMVAMEARVDAALKAMLVPVHHSIFIVPTGKTVTIPAITGAQVIYATVGQAVHQPITALNAPTFSAANLPAGLLCDSAGTIGGTPTAAGATEVVLTATNAAGACTAPVTVIVTSPVPKAPEFTSAKTADAVVGTAFTYRITASNDASDYFAWMQSDHGTTPDGSSLPPGLTYDSHSGVISGTPTKAGAYTLQVAAMNAGGRGVVPVALAVKSP